MTAQADILSKMKQTAKSLVQNALHLIEAAQGAETAEEIQRLQEDQQELIDTLIDLDEALKKDKEELLESNPEWIQVQELLNEFEKANENFISHLSVRKGLIQFEVKDLQKSKQQLNAVKDSYGKQGPSSVSKKNGKRRINTLS